MEFLIRFVQIHESFRRPEIEALAALGGIDVEFLVYNECVCSTIMGGGPTQMPFKFRD